MKTDGTLFLIRSLDISSRNCFLKRCPFSGDVFDQEVAMIFTRKQTNEVKKHPEKYKLITRKQRFDFLDENTLYAVCNARRSSACSRILFSVRRAGRSFWR